ncbi:phasin family protein [Methylobacterium durans]|uniref:phasin family protein n=1 Tax=Methylobacterium durans TaxID=2202825 RepID=UPI002B003C78|nr:phasin family protein [Methylobacterium durans]MEA1830787.1 phasin family protein [Methylobacterium durans]
MVNRRTQKNARPARPSAPRAVASAATDKGSVKSALPKDEPSKPAAAKPAEAPKSAPKPPQAAAKPPQAVAKPPQAAPKPPQAESKAAPAKPAAPQPAPKPAEKPVAAAKPAPVETKPAGTLLDSVAAAPLSAALGGKPVAAAPVEIAKKAVDAAVEIAAKSPPVVAVKAAETVREEVRKEVKKAAAAPGARKLPFEFLNISLSAPSIDVSGMNATVLAFIRNESAAALSHLQALGSAKSPADLIRLQVAEMQRVADASLTCWSDLARKASKIVEQPKR